jgi:hypothetical protein
MEEIRAKTLATERMSISPSVQLPNAKSEPSLPKPSHKTDDTDADDEDEALKDILPNLLEGEELVDMDNLMADDDDIAKTNLDDMEGQYQKSLAHCLVLCKLIFFLPPDQKQPAMKVPSL